MKAWEIIGWTTADGEALCVSCAEERYPELAEDDEAEVEGVRPVFASDEFDGHSCSDCLEVIE